MNICLFTKEEIEQPLSLNDERALHIIKILHKKEGDTFAAGIIGGMAGTATITSVQTQKGTSSDGRKTFTKGFLTYTFTPLTDGKPLNPLIMIIGFPRPIQLKRLLRDMAGLGACEIHLTATELGEKSYLKSDLATTDAGYKMLLEGTEQAAGTHVPLLKIHTSLNDCLSELQLARPSLRKIALDNINPAASLCSALAKDPPVTDGRPQTVAAAIGSERGWTNRERALLEQYGFARLGMGNRVLRTETAATVAASLILGAMGALE